MQRSFVCAVMVCGIMACGDSMAVPSSHNSQVCDLTYSASPASATLSVGDTVRASARNDCAPSDTWRWSVPRMTVASVDSMTGLITALAPGSTLVFGTDQADPTVGVTITIIVKP
jgi:uncharacterized protein YjdB